MLLFTIFLPVIIAFNAVEGVFTEKDKEIIVLRANEFRSKYQTLVQSHAESNSMIQNLQPKIQELEDLLSWASQDTSSIQIALAGKMVLHQYQQTVQLHNEMSHEIQDLQPMIQYCDDLLSIDVAQSTLPIKLATQKALSGPGTLGKALELAQDKASELSLLQVATDIEHWLKENPGEAKSFTGGALGPFAREILSVQGLQDLGFDVKEIRPYSVAAKIESVVGPLAARHVITTWQSTEFAEVTNFNGGVRALTLLMDAAVAKCNPLKDCEGTGGYSVVGGALYVVYRA
ncbi:hypothetical protein G7Y79_00004g012320 [Physcia stellaris]|nr:hypothetical protein G7Y79_00004g012320 [Physcia stellaris]